MSDNPALSEVLAASRRAVGLSQAEAAKRLSVGLNTVARWEQGVATPTDRNLVRALELYETSPEEVSYGPQRRKVELRVAGLEERVRELEATVAALTQQLGPRSAAT